MISKPAFTDKKFIITVMSLFGAKSYKVKQ